MILNVIKSQGWNNFQLFFPSISTGNYFTIDINYCNVVYLNQISSFDLVSILKAWYGKTQVGSCELRDASYKLLVTS